MIINEEDFAVIYREVHESVASSLKNEPILMRPSRVEEILDIKASTRKRLIDSGDLTALKTGDTVQSAMRITKDSVIDTITRWQAESEYKEATK
jgi:hypothetical protein|tara:strand:- start:951 stop:1232 length:282 start_codon:yes stop_codon:yes gene_type:complete